MNTQAFSAFGQGTLGLSGGGLGLGLSFQDFPASQDNYLEFADFSQVGCSSMQDAAGLQQVPYFLRLPLCSCSCSSL